MRFHEKISPQPEFLPVNRADMLALGWDELDILLIQGDAYLDHPAQGPALLGRWLLAHGYKVGLISQPRWKGPEAGEDFTAMGRPRLFAALSAGSLDSMLAHYTAARKIRSDDALSPGGRAGSRPNRATLVYTGLARAAFPGLPVVVGGLEASLRRLSHYDFWQNKLRPSILLDSKADLLIYGPGERPLLELARRLDEAAASKEVPSSGHRNDPAEAAGQAQRPLGIGSGSYLATGIHGTAAPVNRPEAPREGLLILPSHGEILGDARLLLETSLTSERLIHEGEEAPAAFQAAEARGVLLEPPAEALTTEDLDFIHALPFSRRAHPGYREPVPALTVLKTSLTSHRGCGGGCSFCSLALHQGRRIISRSAESLAAEAAALAKPEKPAALSDVGAGTANLWGAECRKGWRCRRVSCLWPGLCPHLSAPQGAWVKMLKKLGALPGLKQVRVASGLRYDLALSEPEALREFLRNFVGGQLKIAPEHLEPKVLKAMRKPGPEVFERFLKIFEAAQPKNKARQYLVPYLISGFPGAAPQDDRRTWDWFKKRGWRPRQTQHFIPTPGTVATALYYMGLFERGGRP